MSWSLVLSPLPAHPSQTGAEGRPCNQLMVVEKVKIANEFYFAILMDREAMGPILVASRSVRSAKAFWLSSSFLILSR